MIEETEIWKPIKELPYKYMVSNHGRIMYIGKYRNKNNRIFLGSKAKNGYYHVNMWDSVNKIYISKPVHRLVAEAFIPNPNNYLCVNHKDENPANNNAGNLEWCTYKYNNEYGTAKNRASKTRLKKGISKKVYVYDLDGNLINEFDSMYSASKYYNIPSSNIGKCCNRIGSYKTVDNKIFRFENDSSKYEKLNYFIILGIYLDDKLVHKSKGIKDASEFLKIKHSTMKGKVHRFKTKNKPMICGNYKIFILEERNKL